MLYLRCLQCPHCWLGIRESIPHVKIEWRGSGIVSCFIKIQISLRFLLPVLAQVVLEKRLFKRVSVFTLYFYVVPISASFFLRLAITQTLSTTDSLYTRVDYYYVVAGCQFVTKSRCRRQLWKGRSLSFWCEIYTLIFTLIIFITNSRVYCFNLITICVLHFYMYICC